MAFQMPNMQSLDIVGFGLDSEPDTKKPDPDQTSQLAKFSALRKELKCGVPDVKPCRTWRTKPQAFIPGSRSLFNADYGGFRAHLTLVVLLLIIYLGALMMTGNIYKGV
jgi:hypothetical protein